MSPSRRGALHPSQPPRHRARRGAVALLVASVVLAPAACGDDDESATETTTSAPTTTPVATSGSATTPTSHLDGIDPMDDAGTEPVRGPAQVTGTALLRDVAVARHEGYDRVVFEFENGTPGHEVAYAPGPFTMDGSGEPVAVAGEAFLQVRMEPASGADLSGEVFRQTYTGPTRVDGDTPEITEVVRTGDFEAVTTWVIGVADPGVAFRVQVLTAPPRLVVDVQNH